MAYAYLCKLARAVISCEFAGLVLLMNVDPAILNLSTHSVPPFVLSAAIVNSCDRFYYRVKLKG